MNCDVIQDLLPLYADNLASDASAALIEEHIKTCETCNALLEQMSSPIEQQELDSPDPVKILRRQKVKNRRRIILSCLCTALIILLGYWIYMETHFTLSRSATVSTDSKEILAEMPDLEITESEIQLSQSIFSLPAVKECSESEMLVAISYDKIESDISHILPPNAEIYEVCASKSSAAIGYILNGTKRYVEYLDTDCTGNTDFIRKSIFVPKGKDPMHTYYKTEYYWEYHITYEKQINRHVLFGFLQMP